jgi:endoglucanase
MISSLSGFLRFAIRALAISLLFVVSASALPAQNAFVRIDQLGYEAGVHNRAYLMSKTSESSAIFRVIAANGEIRYSSPVGAAATWGAFKVYALDFLVNEPGHYTIEVNGPVSTTSATFRIDAPAKLYSGALVNALNFYRNERDGENFIKTPLRSAPGHLNDEHAAVYLSPSFNSDDLILGALKPAGGSIDASGGWWDAGDYLKFVQTHSYTVALMLVGIRDFPAQMGSATNASDFTKEAKFGLDWLLKMWDSKSQTLYYQVGIGTDFNSSPDNLSDHDLWRLPQADDSAPPSFTSHWPERMDRCLPRCITPIRRSIFAPRRIGRTPTSPDRTMPPTRSTSTTSAGSLTLNFSSPSPPQAIPPNWK